MNNQAAQTMPTVPQAFFDEFGVNADDRVMDYGRACYAAALSQTAGVVEPLPMDTAPRDCTMVRLLVNFTDHATEDTAGPAWTIGAYPSDDESGGWQFAGWCWTHDHFTEGEGTPIGWLPMLAAAPAASGAHPDALPDGTLSKSTAKRVEALAASGGDGPTLHPATEDLIRRFSDALREKLSAAEKKYGYSDGWASPDWMDECRKHLMQHIAKGDPRDVAAYCAFLWHHGESTTPQPLAAASVSERALDDLHVAICQAVALMNMEPMTTAGLLQAHDILRKAIS